jgi:hypothetical protein
MRKLQRLLPRDFYWFVPCDLNAAPAVLFYCCDFSMSSVGQRTVYVVLECRLATSGIKHYNTFPFNGGKTYVILDISASSRDLHQQTDDPACWLAEVTVEDSSQSRVQN